MFDDADLGVLDQIRFWVFELDPNLGVRTDSDLGD